MPNSTTLCDQLRLATSTESELSFAAARALLDTAAGSQEWASAMSVAGCAVHGWSDASRKIEVLPLVNMEPHLSSPSWPLVGQLHLKLVGAPNDLARRLKWLASKPQLGHVRELIVEGGGGCDEGIASLLLSPHLIALRRLTFLETRGGALLGEVLEAAPGIEALDEIHLTAAVSTAELESILLNRRCSGLSAITLCAADSEQLEVLGRHTRKGLRALRLITPSRCAIEKLLSQPVLCRGLECLELDGCVLDLSLAEMFGKGEYFGGLAHLALSSLEWHPMESACVELIAENRSLVNLKSLQLGGNWSLGDDGWQAVAAWELPGLERLNLDRTGASSDGMQRLVQSRSTLKLKGLSVSGNELGMTAAAALASAPWCTSLQEVVWCDDSTPLGDQGATALMRGEWTSIRALNLRGAGIGPAGARSFGSLPSSLRRLILDLNPIGDDGAEELAQCRFLRSLDELGLQRCGISRAGIRHLAAVDWEGPLRKVDLSINALDSGALACIARSPTLRGLWSLNLGWARSDNISDGIVELAASPNLDSLVYLGLTGNDRSITPEAMEILANSPHLARLETIGLGPHELQAPRCHGTHLREIVRATACAWLAGQANRQRRKER